MTKISKKGKGSPPAAVSENLERQDNATKDVWVMMNFKCSPEFRAAVKQFSLDNDETITNVFINAFNKYAHRK